jgi:hypothetical protein
MIYNVTIAPIRLKGRPSTKEVATIKNNMSPTGLTYNQLIQHSAPPNSYTIAPALHTGCTINNQSWASQQVYYLDFDGTIAIKEVLDRFDNFGITPNFYYTTFRNTDESPRFRVGLLTDHELRDFETAKRIREGLKRVFPESDPTCFDAARIFFGGTQAFPITEKPIPFYKLCLMIGIVILEEDHGKSRFVPGRVSLLDYNKDTRFETNEYQAYLTYLRSLKNNKVDFEKLAERIRIFRDFLDGVWLYHDQLFGIATALHWLKGGKKLFKETMEKHNMLGNTHYDKYKFRIIDYASLMEYFPMSLDKFSPYPEDFDYPNLLTGIKLPIGKIERIKQPNLISLDDAQRIFDEKFKEALDAKDNKIYIFKLPTGFGKTTHLTNLEGHVLAFPTHDLKDEVYRKMQVESVVTPEVPRFLDNVINSKIDNYYLMGLNEAVQKIIKSVAAKIDTRTNAQDAVLAQQYLTEVKNTCDVSTTLLTTHQRLLLGGTNNSTVIFDEDPIKDLLSVDSTNMDDVILLNAYLPEGIQINELIERIKSAKPGLVYSMPSVFVDRNTLSETIAKHPTKTNVVKFLGSVAFVKDSRNIKKISYVVKRELSHEKKHLIMSATAQVHLYERMYPERIDVLDLTNVELVGKVYQHTDYSYSRTSLTEDLINDVRDRVGNIPIITFKKNKAKFFQDDLNMHFHNVLGYDVLNGSDIAVIGTPHYNDLVYRLIAFAVGLNPNQENNMKVRLIEHGDFRFCFTTYQTREMQQIQLGLIEAELIQAVGRARPLRNDCIVELYSNLPLNFSIINEICNVH